METLQQMAFDALEEAGFSQLVESNDENVSVENEVLELPTGVEKNEDDEGNVTFTLSFSIDPDVQKEKAAAMSKGIKREDQADVEIDETGAPVSDGESAEDDGCNCCVQDSTPFADTLDSLTDVTTEDAGRHSNTPLANCRAKDPMYCPYHGTKATQKFLEDEIANAGGTVPGAIAVETDDGHNFKVSITVPGGTNGQPYVKALSALMAKKGIKASPTSDLATNQSDEVHEVSFNDPAHNDREGQFDEWVDNLLEDYANDNNSPLDPNDLAGFLGDYADYKAMPGNIENTYKNSQTPATQQDVAKAQARDAVEEKYHDLRAQVDMSHVKNAADAQQERTKIGQVRSNAGDWKNLVEEAAHIWDAAGIRKGTYNNKYPQQALAIRKKFYDKYQSLYRRVLRHYESADKELSTALANNDMKGVRNSLHKLADYAEGYAEAFPSFKKVADEYIQAANTYAKQQGVQVPQYQQQQWTP